MIGKRETARVTSVQGVMLQVYYQATYWNAECLSGTHLSVNDFVEVVGGVQLPLQVQPLMHF